MTNIWFDEDNLLETAKVVVRVNEHMRNFTPEHMVEHMKRTAYSGNTNGYVLTAGYVLSFYNDCDGQLCVKASVSSHTVLSYIKNRDKALAEAEQAYSNASWALNRDRQGGI